MMTPRVIDIYVGTNVTSDSFNKAKAAGIWGIIHKATEGTTYRDKSYSTRRKMVSDAGLLWGAYHFNYGNDYKRQVDNFLAAAEPDEMTAVFLDWEMYKVNMSVQAAIAFCKELEDRTGKIAGLYTGNPLRSAFPSLSEADKTYMATRKIWWAQYGPKPVMPKNFEKYGGTWGLWQYTGDGVGPFPHTVPGFGNGIDLNVFNGTENTRDELEQWWIS